MRTPPSSDNPPLPADAVQQFFDQWEIYRKVVAADYLHHCGAYAAIGDVLRQIPRPFSFLDLGSGDASATAAVLKDSKFRSYEAVDISSVALSLAKKNMAGFSGGKKFIQGDFFQHVMNRSEPCDVIFVGLSLHHLQAADKQAFIAKARELLPADGRLIFYEPIRYLTESREDILVRWWEVARTWTELNAGDLQKVKDHVFGYDYPEPVEWYAAMAERAGFRGTRVLFSDADRLYAVFDCEAGTSRV
ncbi:MAG: class I SAM-dependent methyltransferase [Terrimicrobiaceae bacterium]